MHLAKPVIKNFRKLKHAVLRFQTGLMVLIGANNPCRSPPHSAIGPRSRS